MAELVSSASLLFAVITVLFTLWYPHIESSLKIKPALQAEDNVKKHNTVSNTIWTRAVPLAFLTSSMGLIFLPVSKSILATSCSAYMQRGLSALDHYDPARTTVFFVTVVLVGVSLHLYKKLYDLFEKKRELKPD